MQRTLQNNLSAGTKLLLDMLIMIVIFIVTFGLGLFIGGLIYDSKPLELLQQSTNIQNLSILRYIVVLQSISLFMLPALAIAWFYDKPSNFLHMNKKFSFKTLSIILTIILVVQFFVNYLAQINAQLHLPQSLSTLEQTLRRTEEQTKLLTRQLLSGTTFQDLILNLVIVALIPAISEEFFFRGILQRHLIEIFRRQHVGVWLTSFIFAFIHFEFFTFLPRFILGLLLGYIFLWVKSIWAPIIAHFTNNALGVITYFIAVRKNIPLEQLEAPHHIPVWISFISLALTLMLLILLKEETSN